ncbi:hypothetical protein KKB44_03710 [Candidatus Micrarchaeota archaeon]|nr:hypothetical protein [Candidatus Micrarchaeota archaeon]
MKILGVSLNHFLLALFITTVLTIIIFYPAIENFGEVFYGTEDIKFFIWLFWHYENGADPLIADEIFYPYGISLSSTGTTPFQGMLYLFLPDSWSSFGKITVLQILSFILGGIFSFCLVYKFTKSFVPSLIGSFIFNFSAFHFEKAIHHLNYNMGLAFLPLFFMFYYEMLEKKSRRNLIFLAFSLLLVALNEMTIAIMAGFFVFLDIVYRYMTHAKLRIFTPKNVVVFAISIISSLICFEILCFISAPATIAYTLPSVFFIVPTLFIILGKENLEKAEKKYAFMQTMLIIALPVAAYLAFLAIQPSYDYYIDSVATNTILYTRSLEAVVIPTNLLAFSGISPFGEILTNNRSGAYLGLIFISLIVVSHIFQKATKEEKYFRDMFLLAFLFSFPVIIVGGALLAATPFVVETLFPLLPVLRVPARFILFGLLFGSVMIGILCKRLFLPWNKMKVVLAMILMILILAERWPALDKFAFNQPVPEFYIELSKEPAEKSIFLYPNINYYTLLNEVYHQTIHGKKLSYGTVSRFPAPANELFAQYQVFDIYHNPFPEKPGVEETIKVIKNLNYNYIVVQKLHCTNECFYRTDVPFDSEELEKIKTPLEEEFGSSMYEDDSMIVYEVKK